MSLSALVSPPSRNFHGDEDWSLFEKAVLTIFVRRSSLLGAFTSLGRASAQIESLEIIEPVWDALLERVTGNASRAPYFFRGAFETNMAGPFRDRLTAELSNKKGLWRIENDRLTFELVLFMARHAPEKLAVLAEQHGLFESSGRYHREVFANAFLLISQSNPDCAIPGPCLDKAVELLSREAGPGLSAAYLRLLLVTDPELAETHFSKLLSDSERTISFSKTLRSLYWASLSKESLTSAIPLVFNDRGHEHLPLSRRDLDRLSPVSRSFFERSIRIYREEQAAEDGALGLVHLYEMALVTTPSQSHPVWQSFTDAKKWAFPPQLDIPLRYFDAGLVDQWSLLINDRLLEGVTPSHFLTIQRMAAIGEMLLRSQHEKEAARIADQLWRAFRNADLMEYIGQEMATRPRLFMQSPHWGNFLRDIIEGEVLLELGDRETRAKVAGFLVGFTAAADAPSLEGFSRILAKGIAPEFSHTAVTAAVHSLTAETDSEFVTGLESAVEFFSGVPRPRDWGARRLRSIRGTYRSNEAHRT